MLRIFKKRQTDGQIRWLLYFITQKPCLTITLYSHCGDEFETFFPTKSFLSGCYP